MNQERLLQIIQAPHITEKATDIADKHKHFVFKVRRDANKQEVKLAVEKLFEVKVAAVQVLNQKGKKKTMGRRQGQRKGYKKAFVQLMPGHDIDFTNE